MPSTHRVPWHANSLTSAAPGPGGVDKALNETRLRVPVSLAIQAELPREALLEAAVLACLGRMGAEVVPERARVLDLRMARLVHVHMVRSA